MAVEAVVALMVYKLAELADRDTQLLGMHGEVNRIREELDKMRPFLKEADIKQKEDEAVRVWMKDIRDICFDVDDVIDILGQGQAAQERHGFVERLKRRISDQITRYKVSKEIERIKLSIKGIKRSRDSYGIGIGEINEERQEATSSTQLLQEAKPEKKEIVSTTVDDQLTNEERTRDIDEGRQEASPSSRNLPAHRRVSPLPGEPEGVGLQEENNTVGQQLIEEEPGPYDGTRDIDEGRPEANSSAPRLQANMQFSTLLGESEEVGLQEEIDTGSEQLIKEERKRDIGKGDGIRHIGKGDGIRIIDKERDEKNFNDRVQEIRRKILEPTKAKEAARAAMESNLEGILSKAPRLQDLSRRSVQAPPEKIEVVITTVNDQSTNEERKRDIDEGRQEASSSSRNLEAHRPVSTLPGEPEEVGCKKKSTQWASN